MNLKREKEELELLIKEDLKVKIQALKKKLREKVKVIGEISDNFEKYKTEKENIILRLVEHSSRSTHSEITNL